MNLVAALMMMGPVGNRSLSIEDRVDSVFGILAGLTGVATLVQVKNKQVNISTALECCSGFCSWLYS